MSVSKRLHPRSVLFSTADPVPVALPVCDHYCGVDQRMRKSLALQQEMGGAFDVTLDGEDGAPVGGEVEHAHLMAELATQAPATAADGDPCRIGARLPPLRHAAFESMLDVLVQKAGGRWAYLMLPKVEGAADVTEAAAAVDAAYARHGVQRADGTPPLHALIETHGALREVQALAAHPRIESLSFGLMDFVSAHQGAIPLWAMGVQGQFEHPLVVRAKLEIAAACLGHGKVPSHSVVTEFKNARALQSAAEQAHRRLGYLRMWSIHPDQIRPIVDAFSPTTAEIDDAIEILTAAQDADWAPIRHRDTLHDRASYRYFWLVLERAQRTAHVRGASLPSEVRQRFFS